MQQVDVASTLSKKRSRTIKTFPRNIAELLDKFDTNSSVFPINEGGVDSSYD